MTVRANVRGAILPFTSDTPDKAVIEQLDEMGSPIPGKLAISGYAQQGVLYFLDLPPGRYALSKFYFPARGVRYEVELSSAVMRKDAVNLKPGQAVFLGDLHLDGRFPEVDIAVERALEIVGHWITPFLRRPTLPRDADIRSHDFNKSAERQVLLLARNDLKNSQWKVLVDKRLREIGAQEPAPQTGFLRKKEVPLMAQDILSWRDTLNWGKPIRTAHGLVWKNPKGQSRIVIFFTSATTAGFVGYEEAVREMRASAGGLEDPASLYEVHVGTRTGLAARVTAHNYAQDTLTGSVDLAVVTETILIQDAAGMFTVRLRAPIGEFEKTIPLFREFLLQLVLGPPARIEPKQEDFLPL
jgi:hypothetical protein